MATFLYAIGNLSGPVKIGISDNPTNRLSQFQTSCPFPIRLLHAEPCESREIAYAEERHAHQSLKAKHLHGEWFDISGYAAIDCVRDTVLFGAHFRERAAQEEIVENYVKALEVG